MSIMLASAFGATLHHSGHSFDTPKYKGGVPVGIAGSIMAPRVFQHETLPSGPPWDIVQEILDATAGDHPTEIRDHALLPLFAIYGVRSREVARLQLRY